MHDEIQLAPERKGRAHPGFAGLHPLVEAEDAQGALEVIYELQENLKEITGLPGISLQPAAGAHGEMTGVMIIRAYIDARDGDSIRETSHDVDSRLRPRHESSLRSSVGFFR